MLTGAILFVLVLLLLIGYSLRKGKNKSEEQRDYANVSKFATDYLLGHPLLAKPEPVFLSREGDELTIIERSRYSQMRSSAKTLAAIPIRHISLIETSEHTEVEKKFSLGKYLLVGGYALSYPKSDETEVAYLVINWRINGNEYEALFMNKGKEATKIVEQARAVFLHWKEVEQSKTSV